MKDCDEIAVLVCKEEKCEVPDGKTRLDDLRMLLGRWLYIPSEDLDIIDLCLAVYKSNEMPGDPLWAIMIDASGGGKTEMLRAFRNCKDAYFLSKLSDKSLISGYREAANPQKDNSLLPELNGKVLIIKDLAPLLSMRQESRNAIIADLRDAYDGFTDQGKGNLGKVSYQARFTLLAASTQAIERTNTVEQELGERFIKIRGRGDASRDKVRKAVENIGFDDSMRNEIEKAFRCFLNSLPPLKAAKIPEKLVERLTRLADFAAKARSTVARDRGGEIQYLPKAEVGTRLGKEFGKLLLYLALVRNKPEPDDKDFETVVRVAEDTLPPNRLAVIGVLRESTNGLRGAEIEKLTGLPHSTANRTLQDLCVLGLVKQQDCDGTWILVSD